MPCGWLILGAMRQNAVPRSGTMPVASYRPPFRVAFEASLDAGFWRFWRGSNIDAFATPMHCAKGPPGLCDACIVGATFQRPLFVRLLCQNSSAPDKHPLTVSLPSRPTAGGRALGLK